MQFKQTSLYECELSMRHLLCQDVIFNRITCVAFNNRQRQSCNYIDQQMNKKKFMTMKRSSGREDYVSKRQDSDLWIKLPNEDTEICRDKILIITN